MSQPTVPDPLDDLAGRLSRRWIEPPSAELGARVDRDVAAELRLARSRNAGKSWPAFAAGLAAVFVIGASFSFIAASDTRAAAKVQADPMQTQATARAIRELVPELSRSEAMRMSIVDEAGPGFICIPQPRTPDVQSVREMIESNGDKP